MENWAESTLKLKEHMKDLSDCLLHEKWDEIPTLIKAMRMRLDKLEEMTNDKYAGVNQR